MNNGAYRNLGVDANALCSMEFPELEYCLKPWLHVGSLSLLWAMRGAGKTHMAISISHAIATGGSFLCWSAPKPRRVCYLDGEIGKRGMSTWLKEVVSSASEIGSGRFKFVTLEESKSGIIWNLADPQCQPIYTEIIEDAEFIVVDNLATVMKPAGRGLQSDVEQWASVQQWALQQRAKGKSILFLHHAGKSGEQRGTSTKEDVMDIVIGLRRDADYDPENGIDCALNFDKARYIYGSDAQSLRVKLASNGMGGQKWEWGYQKDYFKKKFLQMLNDGRSMHAIMGALRLGRHQYEIYKDAFTREPTQKESWTDTRQIKAFDDENPF